mgnify:CR=1 FL=1
MTSRHLLDPDLHAFVEAFGTLNLSDAAVPVVRAQRQPVLGDASAVGVDRREVSIPRGDEDGAVRALLYVPSGQDASAGQDTAGQDSSGPQSAGKRPAYLHLHGGGYLFGSPEASDARNLELAATLGIIVLSVAYRLAPEHPVPAGLNDAFAAVAWLHDEAETLGVDPERIAIGGESAGGGLAAALALKARDDGRYAICHQHLTYPMLDDRTGSDASPGDPLLGEYVWTRASNRFAWSRYLGESPPQAPWVPARATMLEGLPSTWLLTGALDLFLDENLAWARRLLAAGVPTDLSVYAGACHGFQLAPGTRLAERYAADHRRGLAQALGVTLPDSRRGG